MDRIAFIKDTLDFSKPIKSTTWLLDNGTQVNHLARGIIEIAPKNPSSKAIVLSSGIHGNETSPIEILNDIINDIQDGSLVLQHPCLFIYGHPAATHQHIRFIDTNLNRLFLHHQAPDDAIQEVAIANQLMSSVDDFYAKYSEKEKWHLDLHCAIRRSKHYTFAIHPFNRHYQRSEPLLQFLKQSQIEACLYSDAPASTFSWYSAEHHGAHAATVELGKVSRMGENDFSLLSGFIQELKRFISSSDTNATELSNREIAEYQVTRSIMKKSDEFEFSFAADLSNFTYFEEGESLALDGVDHYKANSGGESVVFPNANVEIGHRACLLVQKCK
ncbi:succinylglutamate desuccinylase [Aliivibrio fischeri]|uniref:succinylglutamate desuccinylase n=1 Tax=Aliivibrio fischeri TaxID=668 RepID=UPI0012DA05FF|nr:succinylglutamate desuccinylase [Aliivibrio fischeri]MUL10302.1 succinylglutamate desuccinylase [Aliivibrio fischeri]MUL12441.1 succinylglutamate desuccinylase [Aliivibrio fischeri]